MFVGRDEELATLRAAAEAPELPFVVAYIHGPGGIGKSSLLQASLSSVASKVRYIALDCREIEPTRKGFLSVLAEALGMQQAEPELGSVAARLGESSRRTILALDTYEAFGLMDTWLRQKFIPALPDMVLTIIAGRDAPNPAWITTPGWRGLFREIRLRELPADDVKRMLASRGLEESEFARASRFARGHPLALELAAAALHSQPNLEIAAGPPPTVLQQLTDAFLSGLPSVTAEAVEAASTVRRLTEPILRALLAGSDVREVFDNLRTLPFVDATTEGLMLHDVVRDSVARLLAQRDLERSGTYRRRAWRLFSGESRTGGNLWQSTADLLYLIENPVVRDAFFPKGASDYALEPATPDAGAEIGDIATTTDGREMAQLIDRWWKKHPETFSVAMAGDGKVAGFYFIFEPDDIDERLLADDPLTAAWSQHLRENPVADEERVLFLRRWLARGTGEAPSPTQGACWLDIKRAYMEMRPNLRRLYTAVEDLATYAPIVTPLGFAPIEKAAVRLGNTTYHTMVLDFGESSVDGWLATLIGSELGASEEATVAPAATPGGLVTILFTDMQSSTANRQQLGDAKAQELLRAHNRIVREALAANGGNEIKHTGDGIMASFGSAIGALNCAIAIQRGIASHAEEHQDSPLAVYIGLNAGEPIAEDDDLFGTSVDLAARICAEAEPSEILVSDVVRQLAAGKEFLFSDQGESALRGFEDPVRLWSVRWREDG